MTESEAIKLLKHYMVAFPATNEWLQKASEHPDQTLEVWAKQLSKTSYEDGRQAVADLIDGVADPVKAYERDQTALHIRAIAGLHADRRRQRAETQANLRYGTRTSRTETVSGFATIDRLGLAPALAEMNALWDEAKKLYPEEVGLPMAERVKTTAYVDEHKHEILTRV